MASEYGGKTTRPTPSLPPCLASRKARSRASPCPYADLPRFMAELGTARAGDLTKLAPELVILTACRSGEVRLARWEEIDLERAEWTIPAERMKAKKAHRFPLSGSGDAHG
ncbi:tyrosine-type recombinase/integrase [Roseivivax sp. CAU 1761]